MSNPEVEVETRNLRRVIEPNIERALAEASSPDEGIWFDLAYSMLPSGPGQMTMHGMIVMYSKSPVLGGPPIPFTVLCDPFELREYEAALDAVRNGVEGMRRMRAQALQVSAPPQPDLSGLLKG